MIVWPGLRRSVSAIQRLFNGASFSAPLTHSLVLERGTGTPTFTRADATNCATFRDWEGVLKTVPSGCARFEGARMVRNLCTIASEDLTNASKWSVIGTASASSPTTALFPASGDIFVMLNPAGRSPVTVGAKLIASFKVSGSGTVRFYLNDGYSETALLVTLTSTPTVYTISRTSVGSLAHVYFGRALGTETATSVTVEYIQLEDVTGQADQSASSYISVGVESAPYHGAGVDGVEFFNTDRDGAVIPAATNTGYLAEGAGTNLCLQSNAFTTTWTAAGGTPTATQNVVGPDGATSAWTVTDNDPANNEAFSTPNILLTAASYTYSMFVKKTTGVQTAYPCLWFLDAAVTAILPCTIDTTNGTATVWTAYTGLAVMAGGSARCASYNADYWRVELTGTGTAANWTVRFGPAITTNPTQSTGIFDVAAQGSAVFYGAMVNLGAFAGPYIPTTTVAVARNADLLTYTGADVASIKTLMIGVTPRVAGLSDTFTVVSLSGAAANKQIYFDKQGAVANGTLYVRETTDQAFVNIGTYTAGAKSKVAGRFSTNNFAGCINGGTVGTDTSGTKPAVTQLNVGTDIAASVFINSPVGPIYGWSNRELSDSELRAITS